MTKKISKAAEMFFKYYYKNGTENKFYITMHSGRNYTNTTFKNFYSKNEDCIDIVDRGNDAPRGGRTGEFVLIKYNEKFLEKWQWYLDSLKAVKEKIDSEKAIVDAEIAALGDQAVLLRTEFKNDPEFLAKIKDRINNFSSRQWRNWVRMKVCQRICNEKFYLLTLSSPEIAEISEEF